MKDLGILAISQAKESPRECRRLLRNKATPTFSNNLEKKHQRRQCEENLKYRYLHSLPCPNHIEIAFYLKNLENELAPIYAKKIEVRF